MTCNKQNGIPKDPQKPMVTSGIRSETPAMDDTRVQGGATRQTRC